VGGWTGRICLAERALFVANVYKELAGHQAPLMAHHDCSRVLEKLVRVSVPAQLAAQLEGCAGAAVKTMTTRHSSHVLQALLAAAARTLDRATAADDADASRIALAVLALVDVCAVVCVHRPARLTCVRWARKRYRRCGTWLATRTGHM
jgi:hypothetical protein